jgi:hypothetical protein
LTFSLPDISEGVTKQMEGSFMRSKVTSVPDIVDQKELITLVRNDRKIGFMYMIYAVSPASEVYSPYCLTYVENIIKLSTLIYRTILNEGTTFRNQIMCVLFIILFYTALHVSAYKQAIFRWLLDKSQKTQKIKLLSHFSVDPPSPDIT